MRLAWMTDLHLDHADPLARERLLAELAASGADAAVVTGDTGESGTFGGFLLDLAQAFQRPVYFVLGNHDCYGGSIRSARAAAARLARRNPDLHYLPAAGVIPLSADTALVGVDGWGDGRAGDPDGSAVLLNDFVHIDELRSDLEALKLPGGRAALHAKLRRLGTREAKRLAGPLAEALERFPKVIVATHVPPFAEAAWHFDPRTRTHLASDDQWQPYFVCRAVGDVLRVAAEKHPDRRLLVLCGHSHGAGVCHPLPNLEVRTGGARYRHPAMQRTIAVG